MSLLDCSAHRLALDDRIARICELLDSTHPASAGRPDVGTATRGISVVLLFAAYENLVTSLCRSVLEVAAGLRVGSKRLHPGFQLFAVAPVLQGVADSGASSVWKKHGPRLVSRLGSGTASDIDTNCFPDDGSYMRESQVELFCKVFSLGHPAPVLRELWGRIDTVVVERNGIAHGRLTADEVGRRYTIDEVNALVYLWHARWTEFIEHVETSGATRDFYRRSR